MMPAYILAGGASRRFGSDKARAHLDGRPLLQRLQDTLEDWGHDVTAVATATDAYADLGIRTIADRRPGLGPLAGLESALIDRRQRLDDGWLLLLSCDTVHLDQAWLAALESAIDERHHAICIRDDRWQAMPGLYHTRASATVTTLLDDDDRSMRALLDRVAKPITSPPGWDARMSVNTPDDLARHRSDDIR